MKGAKRDEALGGGRRHDDRSKDGAGSSRSQRLSERLLLPVANETDAEATCAAVRPYLDPRSSQLVATHVIEKTRGYPDKLPPDAALERAETIFDVVYDHFAHAGYRISTELRYGQSVAEEIFCAAAAIDATAIGFTPQPGGRWMKILTGDVGYKLVTASHRPIVVFPHLDPDRSSNVESEDTTRNDLPFDDVVLPVASVKDVESTRRAALPYLPGGTRVIAVHVLRGRRRPIGSRDEALVESREIRARHVLDRASEWLEGAGFQSATRLEHAFDVVGAIDDVAEEEDADVIVITPRGTARWKKLLSGEVTYELTHRADRPLVVLPIENEVECR